MSSIAVLRRRLAETSRFTGLPAQSRYNLAISTMDDDALEAAGEPFGAPYGQTGFGIPDVLNEILSREPRYLPVNSVQTFQQRLTAMGYAHGVQPSGEWSPYWYGAARRWDRDAKDLVQSGYHWSAAPTKKFFQALSWTVPSEMFKGVYGVAKGIVEQTARSVQDVATNPVETIEEGGALGTGLVVGVASKNPLAGLVAAGVGFAADFFGHDDTEEEEGQQDFWARTWDALTPWDEYKGTGAKHFISLLDTVLLASGVLKGGQLAVQGVRSGGRAFASQTAEKGVLRAALTRASTDPVAPGIAARIARGAIRRPVLGGAGIGFTVDAAPELLSGDLEGVFSKENLQGALIGAAAGRVGLGGKRGPLKGGLAPIKAKNAAIEALEYAPFRRAIDTPLGKAAQGVMTGASTIGITGRLVGGLGSGEELTPIEEAIENAPDLGTAGTVADWTVGLFMYPERLLPWRARDISKVFTEMSTGMPLLGIARAAQRKPDGSLVSLSKAMDEVTETLSRNPDGTHDLSKVPLRAGYVLAQKQADELTRVALKNERIGFPDPESRLLSLDNAKAGQHYEQVRAEHMNRIINDPDFGRQALHEASLDDRGVANYVARIGGIDNMPVHQASVEFLHKNTRAISDADELARLPYNEPDSVDQLLGYGPTLKLEGLNDLLPRSETHLYHATPAANFDQIKVSGLRPGKTRPGETTGVYFGAEGLDLMSLLPTRNVRDSIVLRVNKSLVKGLQKTDQFEPLPSGEEVGWEFVTPEDVSPDALEVLTKSGWKRLTQGPNVVPAVKGEYTTKQDLLGLRERYVNASEAYRSAWNAVKIEGTQDPAVLSAQKQWREVIDDMAYREQPAITEAERMQLLQRDHNGPERKITQRLRDIADTLQEEDEELTQLLSTSGIAGAERYIAVRTGENMLRYDHMEALLRATGVPKAMQRQGFFSWIDEAERFRGYGLGRGRVKDVMATAVRKVDEFQNLGALRYNEMAAQLDLVNSELKIADDGRELARRINRGIRTRYDDEVARLERGETVSHVWGPAVRISPTELGQEGRHFGGWELFKHDPRDLTPDDIVKTLNLDELDHIDDPYAAASKIRKALLTGSAFGGDFNRAFRSPVQQARAMGRGLGIAGLSGFNDFMRTATLPMRRFKDAPKWRRAAENLYEFLPQNLHRASMAMRYSLSPSFDLGRYIEQASLGTYIADIPVTAAVAPQTFLRKGHNGDGWLSPYSSGRVTDRDAIIDAHKFYDEEILGRTAFSSTDELELRLNQAGMANFRPREAETAQAWYLYQKAAAKGKVTSSDIERIREQVFEIGRYGTGQSPLARSVHFVWFPFLFQAKLFRHLHDFTLGSAGRNLLVHEGFRRWYDVNSRGETFGQQFSEYMEKHLPLAQELSRLNNLAFGLGPGRFILEGIADKSDVGKVGQALSSFFVPGGSHQPLADFVGGTAEAAGERALPHVPDDFKHFFVPVVVTEDTPAAQIQELAARLVPAYRDLQTFITGRGTKSGSFIPGAFERQASAVTEGGSSYWQMNEYEEERAQFYAEMEEELGPLAEQAGYASVQSFINSDAGVALRSQVDRFEKQLAEQYPSGFELAQRFSNSDRLKEQYLYRLARKDYLTKAEETVALLGQLEDNVKDQAEAAGVSHEDALTLMAPQFRAIAMEHWQDPAFRELWTRWFGFRFGDIATVAPTGEELVA